VQHTIGKLSTRATSLDLILIGGFHTKLWGPKVVGVPILGILGLPIWESRDKMPFGCGPHGEAQSII